MKKTAVFTAVLTAFICVTANAAYNQSDLSGAIDKAFKWQEQNASPRNSPGSAASDFYVMSLARMNKQYDFDSYGKLLENMNPSTKQDGQRILMTRTACGENLSDSSIGYYTYDADFDSAVDLAGAIITMESGGYQSANENNKLDDMTCRLLTMQQPNGSFGNDVLTTAKSIIAISYQTGCEYKLQGAHEGEEYTYNVDTSISNAVGFLSSSQASDGGFSTIANTAYVIAALDSVGVDADNDSRFKVSEASPVSYIMRAQGEDGSVNGSADDTAMAAFALSSHLRAMQGKSRYFDFVSNDTIDAVAGSDENHSADTPAQPNDSNDSSGASKSTGSGNATQKPESTVKNVNPYVTKAPEHSAVSEEEYGPFPFVGPVQQTEKPNKKASVPLPEKEAPAIRVDVLIAVIIAAFSLIAMVVLYIMRKKHTGIFEKTAETEPEKADNTSETNLVEEMDKPHEVVSEEELFDPDFIKKLIPVEEIDMSIDSLIPADEEAPAADEAPPVLSEDDSTETDNSTE